MKKIISVLLILGILLSFSGCAGNKELYQRLIIKAIGVDRETDAFKVTVRVADYAEDKEYNLTGHGDSVFEAMNLLQLAEGRTPMYSHSHFIIYGNSVCREGLEDALDFFIRYYKAHPRIDVFGAEKTASEILTYENDDGLIPSDRIHKLSEVKDMAGRSVSTTLVDLVADSMDFGKTAMIPQVSMTENGAAVTGTYILQDYKLRDTVTEEETMGLLAVAGELKKGVITAETGGLITAEVRKSKVKLTPSDDFSTWQADIKLQMSLASLSVGSYSISDETYEEIETSLAMVIKNYMTSGVTAAYSNSCDSLKLSERIYRSKPGYWKRNGEAFLTQLPSLKFNINVTVDLDRLGEEEHPN